MSATADDKNVEAQGEAPALATATVAVADETAAPRNADLGGRRSCQACGAKYYDLDKRPIVCPACGTEFDPEVLLKSRRVRLQATSKTADAKPLPAAATSTTASEANGGGLDDEYGADGSDVSDAGDIPAVSNPSQDTGDGEDDS